MHFRWDYGEAVRVTRTLRNDGTYPGKMRGDFLVRRGSVGHVRDHGVYLQDQAIYAVHFLDGDIVVGCREEELIDAEEFWMESRFEVRDIVRAAKSLAMNGEIVVPAGSRGEVLYLDRPASEAERAEGIRYEVHFDCLPGQPLYLPEHGLKSLDE